MLYQHAKSIDRELAQAVQHIQELAFGHKGVLAIGTTVGGAASLVALAICKLQVSQPGIDIRIVEEPTIKSLLTQLHDRTVDMLVCQRPHELELKGAQAFSLFRAKRVACVRTEHPLKGENITLQDLSAYPFVCPPEEMGMVFGFRQIFSGIGLDLPEVLVSNSIYVAKEIVLQSDAYALFSEFSVLKEHELGLMRLIELEIPTQYWMQLILRAEQAPTNLIKSFVTEMLAVCKEINIDVHSDTRKFLNLRA